MSSGRNAPEPGAEPDSPDPQGESSPGAFPLDEADPRHDPGAALAAIKAVQATGGRTMTREELIEFITQPINMGRPVAARWHTLPWAYAGLRQMINMGRPVAARWHGTTPRQRLDWALAGGWPVSDDFREWVGDRASPRQAGGLSRLADRDRRRPAAAGVQPLGHDPGLRQPARGRDIAGAGHGTASVTRPRPAAVAAPPEHVEPPLPFLVAEQSLIGSLLIDNTAFGQVAGLVSPGDCYAHDHRTIFGAIAQIIEAGLTADVITVFEHLQRTGQAEACGGLAYLNALAQSVPSAANMRRYAELVREGAIARSGLAIGDEMREALSRPGDPRAVLASFSERLAEASGPARQPAFVEVDLGHLEHAAPRPQGWFWDGYLPAGHVTLLGGHGGAGKSTIALMLAGCLATGREFMDKPAGPANVLFYSAEDPRVTCATCSAAHGDWCAAHPLSGLPRGYIGAIVTLSQHCPTWQGARQ